MEGRNHALFPQKFGSETVVLSGVSGRPKRSSALGGYGSTGPVDEMSSALDRQLLYRANRYVEGGRLYQRWHILLTQQFSLPICGSIDATKPHILYTEYSIKKMTPM